MKMKKLFIITVLIFSAFAMFASNIDRVYAAEDTPSWAKTSNKISCGPISNMPKSIPHATSLIVLFIEILTPALLIVMGSIDLYKAIASGKEDNIKKNRDAFISRLVAALIVFLIIAITKVVINVVAKSQGNSSSVACVNCFISDKC